MSNVWTNLENVEDEEGGYVSITEAMEIPQAGCVVRVRSLCLNHLHQVTQISESLTFVPWVKIGDRMEENIVMGRKLVPVQKF